MQSSTQIQSYSTYFSLNSANFTDWVLFFALILEFPLPEPKNICDFCDKFQGCVSTTNILYKESLLKKTFFTASLFYWRVSEFLGSRIFQGHCEPQCHQSCFDDQNKVISTNLNVGFTLFIST